MLLVRLGAGGSSTCACWKPPTCTQHDGLRLLQGRQPIPGRCAPPA
ncbi:hypothetical protein J4732_02055 [Serratia marcescens]|uniref:Uncharacterized protein n=1 Tax=Serratia marcescens TaxID=615 RepID=A0A939NKH1_SERMA|nr:hypothetical protein [Serratia marcescens]